ncbi:MAG: ATP-binding cassette domain-containing protein [Deltaproteobacteria bacterium]|nr:MAG: ATP-binding cassette domain-containing protein [Deltaproteobacteria bacterium]TMQ14821.1 MAG: ATP-binding cassette domain-containing protein [Deltaproteobacteria bacterium]
MITNQPGIELIDVRLDHPRGGPPLVRDANLRVTGGERALIVGAAGVGTSRLVAAVLGEVTPGAGRIEVLGRDVGKLRRSSLRLLRRRVGIVPQDLCLLEDRSAQLNIVLPLEIDGIPRSISIVNAARVIALLGLEAEAAVAVGSLSMAARQRVAVARALVREPELLIADHPTSAQDAEGAELVCHAIADAANRGTACLVLGRDPALRAIAERDGWRQLAIASGLLRPLSQLALDGDPIDSLLCDESSLPVAPADAPVPPPSNVLAFPIVARSAGAR